MGHRPGNRREWTRSLAWGLAGVGVLLTAGVGVAGPPPAPRLEIASPSAAARRETRPTLDPARFVGKARLAHQVAREIPDVLDRLYCYCECDKHLGHKSLLSCYTDGHAAT
jgi:hypothetical protein